MAQILQGIVLHILKVNPPVQGCFNGACHRCKTIMLLVCLVTQFLELPYLGGRFAMQLFLPKDAEGIAKFLSVLSYGYWRELAQKARKTDVVVSIRNAFVPYQHVVQWMQV